MSRRNDWPAITRRLDTPNRAPSNLSHKPCFLPSQRENRPPEPKKAPAISLSEPFPLLDPGHYVAVCTEATFAWARQWKKWIARLVLEPQNYQGRPYTGRLCAFLGLGKNPERPYAGPHSRFRRLFVEVNGEQPTTANVGMEIFVRRSYEIDVETVKQDRDGKPRSPEHWYSIVRQIHPCKAGSCDPRTLQPSNTEPSNPLTLRTQGTLTTDQHSNTANTPLAEEIEKANQKLVSLRSEREKAK